MALSKEKKMEARRKGAEYFHAQQDKATESMLEALKESAEWIKRMAIYCQADKTRKEAFEFAQKIQAIATAECKGE